MDSVSLLTLIVVVLPLAILILLSRKPTLFMTIAISKNPGLIHQECGGGVTLTTDTVARKNTVFCAGCHARAEFDLIYEKLFGFALEDRKQRYITIRRYRDSTVKGRILLTAP